MRKLCLIWIEVSEFYDSAIIDKTIRFSNQAWTPFSQNLAIEELQLEVNEASFDALGIQIGYNYKELYFFDWIIHLSISSIEIHFYKFKLLRR